MHGIDLTDVSEMFRSGYEDHWRCEDGIFGPGSTVITLPFVLHIDAVKDDRDLLAKAFTESAVRGVLHSLSSASNALLYLNGLGPFKGSPRPQLIIVDLYLPQTNGADFLGILASNTRFRSIRTAVTMTAVTEAALGRCRAFGVDTYLTKPRTTAGITEAAAVLKAWLAGGDSRGHQNTLLPIWTPQPGASSSLQVPSTPCPTPARPPTKYA
jgi:CheY-like chemotaxis protein